MEKLHIYFIFSLAFVITCPVFSQNKDFKGNVKGIIIDEDTKNPLEYVSVALLRKNDSTVVNGMLTNSSGVFALEGLPFGIYMLKYSYVGYKNGFIDSISVTPRKPTANLEKLVIKLTSKNIDAVVVKGDKSIFENKIDRKVFNVDKAIVSQSGSASDVLQQVPSVTVDVEGNVSLRGSENVTILVNGKPSLLTENNKAAILQQIPANTIDKIEVITNPSAKFDPDGTSGIINIVLKQGISQGLNGSSNINIGNNNKYNGSVNINYFPGKFSISASYSYRYEPRWFKGFGNREIIKNDTSRFTTENSTENHTPVSHMGRLGFDYYFNSNLSAGINGSIQARSHKSNEMVNYVFKNYLKNMTDSTFRSTNGNEDELGKEAAFYILKKFDQPGREWRTDITYDGDNEKESNYYKENSYINPFQFPLEENYTNNNFNNTYTFQSDLTWPINTKSKIEAGYKGIFRKTEDNLNALKKDTSQQWINEDAISNDFTYEENIHAIYSTYSQEFGKFSIMGGFRLEQAYTKPYLSDSIKKSKNYFSYFPTMHLVEKFNDNNELSLSYSRRINRPRLHDLNPFADYSDPRNLRVGNLLLKPEYVNSLELGYTKKIENITLQPTVFYRITEDGFTRFSRVLDSITNITSITNLSSNKSIGFEMLINYQIFKFWNINLSGTAFQNQIDASNLDSSYIRKKFNWGGKLMSSTFLPFGIAFQFSAFYRSPFITPQGISKPFYSANIGLKKDLLKSKATFTITVSDIFNTQRFAYSMKSNDLIANMSRKRESQIAYLGFSYRFGKTQDSGKKGQKVSKEREQETPQEDMMY